MIDAIQFHSRVGDDGVLDLHLNLGRAEAKKDVVVTIQSASADANSQNSLRKPWSDFIAQTYGSCAGLGLARPDQGEYEQREPMS
jgi:hypothetical protein